MDRVLQVRTLLLSLAVTCISANLVSAQAGSSPDLRLHSLTSSVFSNTRTIRVLLPAGYDAPENRRRKYPVLYLNDGQNLFDAEMSVFNRAEWRVDETVKNLIATNKIEPIIVVGIDNAGRRDRANEYLPYPDRFLDPPLPDPQGRRYPKFLSEEVMPLIERNYRVKTGRQHTGIGGSSYGALISLYSYLKLNNKFGIILLESPSFYVADTKILSEAEMARRLPERVYLGVGTNEGGSSGCNKAEAFPEAVTDVLRLQEILLKKGLRPEKLKTVIAKCARHHEDAWAERFPAALTFLFPK